MAEKGAQPDKPPGRAPERKHVNPSPWSEGDGKKSSA